MPTAPTATFPIKIDSNAKSVAGESTSALEAMRSKIEQSQKSIASMSASMRLLKGKSEEVTKAKAALKASIDAEKNAVSQATLAILKQGSSYTELAAKATQSKKSVVDGSAAQALALEGLAAAAAAAAAAVVALGAGVVYGLVALGRFILTAGGAARQANLLREASTGSAIGAANLGSQVDALAGKVDTAKGALNELASSLARGRLSGQTLVDTLNAIGQESAALGDEAGNKIRSFLERGSLTKTFSLNQFETQGTGIKFDNVAKALASQLHVGLEEAQAALVSGRVKLADGARAMRAAVEQQFGELNARKKLDLGVQVDKLHESLAALTTGVNLEPLLKAVSEVFGQFSQTSASGRGLKQLVTLLGTEMVQAAVAAKPIVIGFIQGAINAALKFAVVLYEAKIAIKKSLGNTDLAKDIDITTTAINAGRVAVYGLLIVFGLLAVAVTVASIPMLALAAAIGLVVYAGFKAGQAIQAMLAKVKEIGGSGKGMNEVGVNLVKGLLDGIKSQFPAVTGTMTKLSDLVQKGFTGPMEIKSPSRKMFRFGAEVPAGTAGGIDSASYKVKAAMGRMLPSAPSSSGAGGIGAGEFHLHLHVGDEATADKMREPSMLRGVTKAIQDALRGRGIPVPT